MLFLQQRNAGDTYICWGWLVLAYFEMMSRYTNQEKGVPPYQREMSNQDDGRKELVESSSSCLLCGSEEARPGNVNPC